MNAELAFEKFSQFHFEHCLDIGSGEGLHTQALRDKGKEVTAIDFIGGDVKGDYLDLSLKVDAVWCCHVLEHQPNVNLFLRKIFADLIDAGVFCITVPPLKHEIVGGHLSLWNPGLLCYHLIVAGFDLSGSEIILQDYNISVLGKKIPRQEVELKYDYGDIDTLSDFFPIPVKERFDGEFYG